MVNLKQYNLREIKEFLHNYFINNNLILKNEKILLKPNLISPKTADKGVNTHPAVIQAVGEYLKDFNNKIFIGDSPGVGTLKLNLKVSGILEVVKKLDISIYNFKKCIEIKKENNKILKNFKIADAAFNFDRIINIAKLKTHCMTDITLCVKNCYGFIVGREKVKYHLKAGHNINLFADILIDIFETVNPEINIIDGILGMEGNGPTSGNRKYFKIFGISQNGYLLDRAVERLVGFKRKTVVSYQATKRGLLDESLIPELNLKLQKIKRAKSKSARFRIPKFITDIFMAKPSINNKVCKKCMKCFNSCPPQAIIYKDGKLEIDYLKCIRCFCCHELCIYGAVDIKRLFF